MNTTCTCGTELIYDEKRKCWNCQKCRPVKPMGINPPEKPINEARIRAIVKEMILPLEAKLLTALEGINKTEKSWTDQAKKLGISLMKETGGRRKKEDVLKDIEEKLKDPETDNN